MSSWSVETADTRLVCSVSGMANRQMRTVKVRSVWTKRGRKLFPPFSGQLLFLCFKHNNPIAGRVGQHAVSNAPYPLSERKSNHAKATFVGSGFTTYPLAEKRAMASCLFYTFCPVAAMQSLSAQAFPLQPVLSQMRTVCGKQYEKPTGLEDQNESNTKRSRHARGAL